MPLYTFTCEFCGRVFDEFDTMDGKTGLQAVQCPSCGSVEDLVRHIGTVGYRQDHTVKAEQ